MCIYIYIYTYYIYIYIIYKYINLWNVQKYKIDFYKSSTDDNETESVKAIDNYIN